MCGSDSASCRDVDTGIKQRGEYYCPVHLHLSTNASSVPDFCVKSTKAALSLAILVLISSLMTTFWDCLSL